MQYRSIILERTLRTHPPKVVNQTVASWNSVQKWQQFAPQSPYLQRNAIALSVWQQLELN
jgi:hypothetical protein